jgi:hypothetical protein
MNTADGPTDPRWEGQLEEQELLVERLRRLRSVKAPPGVRDRGWERLQRWLAQSRAQGERQVRPG